MWITFPNSYYDPQRGHALYQRLSSTSSSSPTAWDSTAIGVNEHHQNAYGLMPQPGVIAGALARRTKGTHRRSRPSAAAARTTRSRSPKNMRCSIRSRGGRLIAGFVRGIGAEYHSMGINPTESLERFREAHDLIRAGLDRSADRSVSKASTTTSSYVNTWPRPYQQPHPPIWIPSQGSTETIDWAAHPDRKYTYLQTYSPFATLKQLPRHYTATRARAYGYEPSEEQLGWMAPVYVADTDEEAYARSEAARRSADQQVPAAPAGDRAATRAHEPGLA